jgi:phosphoglycerate kinase
MRCDVTAVPYGVALLRDRLVRAGERWIYSAGFNVGTELADTTRIDTELADLARLADAGARVAVLSHQGSHRAGTARPIGYIARYLSRRLGRPVRYVEENTTQDAVRAAENLACGEIALFGNTRAHSGEESNDPVLAAAFARLGNAVAVGGFSKAHRANASNVGILARLPGYAADSLVGEIAALAPWADVDERYSVAVLGGVKPEKTLIGLENLTNTYDLVIPGGVVLNTLLTVLGHDVGRSELGEEPERCTEVARRVFGRVNRAELHIPEHVTVADPDDPLWTARTVPVSEGVPTDYAIVDFDLAPWATGRLKRLAGGGRALIAGTPSRYRDGFGHAVDAMLTAFAAPRVRALLLGGDTVAELPWNGPVSGGGGSALAYLADGTCAVIEALRRNVSTGEESSA